MCASLPALEDSPAWSSYQETFTFDPGATAATLFLYADGDDLGEPTVIEYRTPAVLSQRSVELTLSTTPRVAPSVAWKSESPSQYTAEISAADGPFVLVLADSFANGWRLEGLPEGWSAQHLEVDGYANGWRVEGEGDATLTMHYGPSTMSGYAAIGSAGTAAVMLAMSGVGWQRRRTRRTPWA